MFETFAEQLREAIGQAQHEARLMGHDTVGVEHLLLGLLMQQRTIAGRVLTQFGVVAEPVRDLVRQRCDGGVSPVAQGRLVFSAEAKAALGSAYRFGLGEPSTEHLLVVLLGRGEDGGVCEIVRELGADPRRIRSETKRQAWPSDTAGPRPRLKVRTVPLLDELNFGE